MLNSTESNQEDQAILQSSHKKILFTSNQLDQTQLKSSQRRVFLGQNQEGGILKNSQRRVIMPQNQEDSDMMKSSQSKIFLGQNTDEQGLFRSAQGKSLFGSNLQDQVILKSSSRKVIIGEQYRDLESAPIYRAKRSSKKIKLSLVQNQPFSQLKLCYICHKSCVIKFCQCDDIKYHPECILSMIKRPSFSLQTFQCPYCLCFFKTEIKNKKFNQRMCFKNLVIFILILMIIIFILIGLLWNAVSTNVIIVMFIAELILSLLALYSYRKITYVSLEWKLVIVGTEPYDQQAFENAKLIYQAYNTETAQYLSDNLTI